MGAAVGCMEKRHRFVNDLSLSDKQVECVLLSWDLLKQSGRTDEVGVFIFKQLFVVCPETFALFGSFRDIKDWENSRAFKHHCKVVVQLIGYLAKVIRDPELLDRNMDYMGMRHSYFHITPQHFDEVGKLFIRAFQEILADKFTPEMTEAWTVIYTVLSTMLQQHMHHYNNEFEMHYGGNRGEKADDVTHRSDPVANSST